MRLFRGVKLNISKNTGNTGVKEIQHSLEQNCMNARKWEFAIFSSVSHQLYFFCHAFRTSQGNAGLRNSGIISLFYNAGMIVKTYV